METGSWGVRGRRIMGERRDIWFFSVEMMEVVVGSVELRVLICGRWG